MGEIATYVFLDLGTTKIHKGKDVWTLKITEIAMLALERSDISDSFAETWSRVNKFRMCLNPGKLEEHELTENAKLNNESLEFETKFDENVLHIMNLFLKCQKQPVCWIAHNGHRFDFPILSEHLQKIKKKEKETNPCWLQNIMCADSAHAFYDIIQARPPSNPLEMKSQNESTPKKQKGPKQNPGPRPLSELIRNYFNKSGISYQLSDVYTRELGKPKIVPHPVEHDCILIAELFINFGDECMEWFDNNYCRFLDHTNQTGHNRTLRF